MLESTVRRVLGALIVVVLSGLPSVAAACAMLCHHHRHGSNPAAMLTSEMSDCCATATVPTVDVAAVRPASPQPLAAATPALIAIGLFDRPASSSPQWRGYGPPPFSLSCSLATLICVSLFLSGLPARAP